MNYEEMRAIVISSPAIDLRWSEHLAVDVPFVEHPRALKDRPEIDRRCALWTYALPLRRDHNRDKSKNRQEAMKASGHVPTVVRFDLDEMSQNASLLSDLVDQKPDSYWTHRDIWFRPQPNRGLNRTASFAKSNNIDFFSGHFRPHFERRSSFFGCNLDGAAAEPNLISSYPAPTFSHRR